MNKNGYTPLTDNETPRQSSHERDIEEQVVPFKPAIPLNEKAVLRNAIMGLLFVALCQEVGYFFYQAQNSGAGAKDAGAPSGFSSFLGYILAFGDFIANITATNPNEVDGVAFASQEKLNNMWLIIPTVTLLSWGSYAAGALASSVPVLKYFATAKGLSNEAKQWLNPLAEAFFGPTGWAYYTIFNAPSLGKTYKATSNFLENPSLVLERITKRPSNLLRYAEVFLFRAVSVIALRAVNFAFIPEDLLPPLLKPYHVDGKTIDQTSTYTAGITGVDTAIQVAFTRVYRSWEKLAHIDFDTITDEEYEAVREGYRMSLQTWLADAASLITAIGYGVGVHSLMSQHEWDMNIGAVIMATVTGSLVFAKSVYVEHTAEIYRSAVAKKKEQLIAAEPEAATRMSLTEKHFNELAETFTNSYRDNFFTGCNIVGRTARSLAFYEFIKFFAGQLATAGIDLTNQQIDALCMILLPENFKNDFLMFEGNIKETIQGYLAKVAIDTYTKGKPLTWAECMYTYFKSPNSYDVDTQIIPTLEKRNAELGLNLEVLEPLLRSATPAYCFLHGQRSTGRMDSNDSKAIIDQQIVLKL